MRYNEEVKSLLNEIECIISKEYDESIGKLTTEYEFEIARLNAVIDAYKELLIVSQAKEETLKERLSWKDSTESVYIVK